MAACTLPLREALNDSISSGRFIDTKIILYSRRDSSGAITKPKALYANSHVLKSVPYFSHLLSGTYLESEPKDFSKPIDEEEQADNYGHCADSDLEDDDDGVNATGKAMRSTPPRSNSLDPLFSPVVDHEAQAPVYGEWNESSEKGLIIKVHDIAFITFQAFLMYLYTGQIEFAPYGSEENRRSRSSEIVSLSEDLIPRASPKSIYRLAHAYDIPALQKLALDNIRNGLKRCDTVEEVFSEFSSKYEEVRTMHINCLVMALSRTDEDSGDLLHEKMDEKIDCYFNGDLDHAADAIIHLWKLSKANECSPQDPSDEASPAEPSSSPANLTQIEVALIKSIHRGIFFDRKYWTRHSKVLRPIYLLSIVAGEKLVHINHMVKMYREGEFPNTNTGEESGDSDCESISESTTPFSPDGKGEKEPEPLPVLTEGSFASWRSLFFYMCTDVVQFAHLKSQGVGLRARHVEEQTTPDKPPPCSPKTIYSLATALEIRALRSRALDDIRLKITAANVVTELFSGFTSRQADIARMECIMGGNSAHRSGALKLGLRQGLSGGVFLCCPYSDCDLHKNSASCHSLGSSIRCLQGHSRAPYLKCSGCGASRSNSDCASLLCQGCKKWFK